MDSISDLYGAFSIQFKWDDQQWLMHIIPEMAPATVGIQPLGSYFVYCVHPERGSITFIIEQDEKLTWYCKHLPPFIDTACQTRWRITASAWSGLKDLVNFFKALFMSKFFSKFKQLLLRVFCIENLPVLDNVLLWCIWGIIFACIYEVSWLPAGAVIMIVLAVVLLIRKYSRASNPE